MQLRVSRVCLSSQQAARWPACSNKRTSGRFPELPCSPLPPHLTQASHRPPTQLPDTYPWTEDHLGTDQVAGREAQQAAKGQKSSKTARRESSSPSAGCLLPLCSCFPLLPCHSFIHRWLANASNHGAPKRSLPCPRTPGVAFGFLAGCIRFQVVFPSTRTWEPQPPNQAIHPHLIAHAPITKHHHMLTTATSRSCHRASPSGAHPSAELKPPSPGFLSA